MSIENLVKDVKLNSVECQYRVYNFNLPNKLKGYFNKCIKNEDGKFNLLNFAYGLAGAGFTIGMYALATQDKNFAAVGIVFLTTAGFTLLSSAFIHKP